jgi:hypothetical protein
MRHKQNVDLLFSASSRIQTPKQNPIAVFAKTPVKEEFNRDFAWSLRIVEKSLNLEMEKTFKKSSRDASSLIER